MSDPANFDPDRIAMLLEAGWIARSGDGYMLTEAGKARIRRGFTGNPGPTQYPIDSTLARNKPPIKKKHKRNR